MRIIEQIVDYLLQQGALTTEDEQYLSDSGYIRPRSWLAPDEVRASAGESADGSAAIEGESPHEGLISQLERGAASRSRRRGGPLHRLSAQTIGARIRAARPAWRDRLNGLLPLARVLQPGIDAVEAPLAIGRLEPGPLADAIARLLTERKGRLSELWDALCVDDYHGLVPEKSAGPAVEAWNALLRADGLLDLDRHTWLLRYRQCAWVFQLRCAQIRLLKALGILVARRDPALERALVSDAHPTGFWTLALLYNGRRILQGHPAGEPLPYLSECAPTVPLPSAACLGRAAGLAAGMDHEGLIALLRASTRPQWRATVLDYKNDRITVRDVRDAHTILFTVPNAGFCDVSRDGRRLAVVMKDSSLHVYDTLTGMSACVNDGKPFGARRPIFCADGATLAAIVHDDGIWELNFYGAVSLQLRCSRDLSCETGGSGPRLETAVRGDLLAITRQDMVQVWDVRTASLVAEITAHAYYPPQAVAMSPDGRTIVTVCSSGVENVSRLYAEQLPKRRAKTHRSHARIIGEVNHGYTYHMLYALDSHTVACSFEDGTITLFDLDTRAVRKEWKAHATHATSLDVSEDGSLLLSAGEDGRARLWDTRSAALLQEFDLKRAEKAKLGQAHLRPVLRELLLVCPKAWRQPYPSRRVAT